MTTIAGTVLAISQVSLGDVLAADATAGDTTITVDDAADFAEGGGTILIGGQLDDYTSVDDETGVMVLVDALNADALQGDRVDLADPAGSPAREWQALVAPQGSVDADEAIEATLNYAIVPLLPEGIRDPGTGESVTLTRDGTEWQVTNVHGQQPDLHSDNLAVPVGDQVRSTPDGNTAAGTDALAANVPSSGNHNTAFGDNALSANTTSDNNTAVGDFALSASDAPSNTAVGANALVSVTSGPFNTAVGAFAGSSIDTGDHNTIVGEESALDLTSGSYNTAIGQNAANGGALVTGSYNTLVGSLTSLSLDVGGTVVIGCNSAGVGALAGSDDAIVIGGGSVGPGSKSITIGINAATVHYDDVAIGQGSAADNSGVAVGALADASGYQGVALGRGAYAGATSNGSSVAIGFSARAEASHTMAIGSTTAASAAGTVAIGVDNAGNAAAATGVNDFVLGVAAHKVSVPGDFGVHGATPVGQSATPTTLADVIAILQAHGFCA